MAKIVGLDIGTRTIAGAVFDGNARRFRLSDFFVEEVPGVSGAGEEMVPPASVEEVIQKLLADRNLEGADVVAAIDAKDCIIREIPVPFTKDEHIKKTIISEAENYFQTFDIEDVILEYFKVEEMGDKSRVLIAAVKKATVRERLEVLKQAGVDPVALDLDAAALFNAFALTPTFDPERNTLLVDMGATSTKVLLVEKGQLKKVRSIRMNSFLNYAPSRLIPAAEPAGGFGSAGSSAEIPLPASYSIEARFQEIENALRGLDPIAPLEATGLALDEDPIAILTDEEFDQIRRSGALPAQGRVETLEDLPVEELPTSDLPPHSALSGASGVAPEPPRAAGGNGGVGANGAGGAGAGEIDYGQYLRRLGLEIQRTFASVSSGSAVELICLTGGMSHREEARRFFTEEFDVETIDLDFGDSFPSDLSPEAQGELSRVGAVAVGLAMKELGGDRVGFDFRKKEFRFERRFERIKYPILSVAALTFLVFLQSTYYLYNKHRHYSEKLRIVQAREQEMFKEFFGKDNSSKFLHQQALNEKKNWERLLGQGGGNIPAFVPVIDALDEITKAIQETNTQPRVEQIDLKLRTRTQKGRISAESPSGFDLTTAQQGLGTQIEKGFGKPAGIFSANASETKRGNTGTVTVNVKLTPQDKYLNDLRK